MAGDGSPTVPADTPTRISRPGAPSTTGQPDGKATSTSGNAATPKGKSAPSAGKADDQASSTNKPASALSTGEHAGGASSLKKDNIEEAKAAAKKKFAESNKVDDKRSDGKTAENGSESQSKAQAAKSTNAPSTKSTATSNSSKSLLSSPQTPTLAPLTPTLAPTGSQSATSDKSSPAAQPKNGTTDGTTESADKTPSAPDNGKENYPTVGKLESITFGAATPSMAIEKRLEKLETTVLKKTYPQESLFDRTERLKNILTGGGDEPPEPSAMMPLAPDGPIPDTEVSSGPAD